MCVNLGKIMVVFCFMSLIAGTLSASLSYPSFGSVSEGAKWCRTLREETKMESKVPYPMFSDVNGACSWCSNFLFALPLGKKCAWPYFTDVSGFCSWCQKYYMALKYNVLLVKLDSYSLFDQIMPLCA